MAEPMLIDGLEIVCVDDVDGLDQRTEAWDALASRQGPCIPMFGHAWISMLFRIYAGPDDRWFVLFCYDAGELVGVMPIWMVPHRVFGASRPRARVPCDYQTSEGDVLLERDRASRVLRALIAGLRTQEPNVWRLELGCVRDDSPTHDVLSAFAAVTQPDGRGSRIPIHGELDTWAASLSKSLRRDIRRGENKIAREGVEATFEFLAGADADPTFLDEVMRIEASGWKGKQGLPMSSDPVNTEKHRYLASKFAERGQLEWHALRLDGAVAAVHFAVRMGESLMLLKQAYDDAFSKYHVGHLLLKRAVEREYERGEGHELNLVTDWAWCRRWNMSVHPYQRASIYPGRPLARLAHAARSGLRRMVGQVPGVRRLRQRTQPD